MGHKFLLRPLVLSYNSSPGYYLPGLKDIIRDIIGTLEGGEKMRIRYVERGQNRGALSVILPGLTRKTYTFSPHVLILFYP